MGIPDLDLKKAIASNRLVGLWRLMKGFQLDYLGATFFQGLSAYAKTATYLLLSTFVDSFLVTKKSNLPLWGFAAGFIILAAFQGIFTFFSGKLAAKTAEGTILRLRNYLYDHIQHLSYAYHAESDTGELIQRCTSDVDALRRFYNDQAIGVGRILLLFAVNLAALIQIDARLALLSVIVVPLVIAVSLYFFRLVSKAYEAYQEQDAVLSTILQENVSGVRVVKAFSRQPYEIEKFDRDNWEKFKLGKKLLIMHSLFWPITDILCGAQMLGGLLLGAMMVINGQITIGIYLAYTGLIVWILYPLRGLGRLIVQMSNGMVSYDRVFKIIREDREPLDDGHYQPKSPVRGDIALNNVSFEYGKDDRVLHNISFEVAAGQVVALLGSTGSGKTTLVNLLPRFYDCTSGQIKLDGVDLKSYSRRFLRQIIGIVEQEPFLFSRSIRENITYGIEHEVSQEEVERVARMAAIHDTILGFPDGYRTLVGERGVTLSGGQKQRIAIARTLLKDPRILILDDSTSSVDTETEIEIRQAMESLMHGRTTFIIAHRIQSIMNAALILVMEDGRILQQGNHDTLIRQDGIYKQIYEIQTRIESELEKEIASAS